MNKKIYDAFDSVRAEEQLKQDTLTYIEQKIRQKKSRLVKKLAFSFATIMVIMLTSIFSYDLYYTKAFYLDLDVNPSIELTVNRFERVIAANAYNKEGEQILASVSIKNKTYKEALKILVNEMSDRGYIAASKLFSATLQTENSSNDKELLKEMKSFLNSILKPISNMVDQEIFEIDAETKAAADALELSPAKYLAIEELQSLDQTTTYEHYRDHSISEIHEQIEICRHGNMEKNSPESSGHGNMEKSNSESEHGHMKNGSGRHGHK